MYATPFVCFTVSECELHLENRNFRDTDAVKTMLFQLDRLLSRNTRSLKFHGYWNRPESCLLAVKIATMMIHPAGGKLGLPRWGGREAGGVPSRVS